jgi:hypothetical protein
MKHISPKIILKGAVLVGLAAILAACSSTGKYDTKDLSSQGYSWGFFQHAAGTEHDRQIDFFVDRLNDYPGVSYNVLQGSYYNTGTEAPEHLRDPAGKMIFTQNENRRYFDFWENDRNDISRIMLFNPLDNSLNSAFMSRFKTEWWGNADMRAVSVNGGPVMLRVEGESEHFFYESQETFAVAIPKSNDDLTWMFNQDNAGKSRELLENLLVKLENTQFEPKDYNMLISTWDNDKFLDWAGLELSPAQGKLFDGEVQYVIGASYFGPHNKVLKGGFLGVDLWGHEGAPDKSNKLGKSLDTVIIALGNADTKDRSSWQPRAKIVLDHPSWSNQTEYNFIRINDDGTEQVMGVLQRTYNNKSISDSDGKVVSVVATNNYLAKGDTSFINQCLVLLGGQQIPLGFDYKTSFQDYATDLTIIAQGITNGNLNPEMVASLNVNADATIGNVVDAAQNVLRVKVPSTYLALKDKQLAANKNFQNDTTKVSELKNAYGIK